MTRETNTPQATATKVPFKAIQCDGNTLVRRIDPAHVVELCESIAEVGLVGSIGVDRAGWVFFGGHRYVALKLLREAPAHRGELFELLDEHDAFTWPDDERAAGKAALIARLAALPGDAFAAHFAKGVPVLKYDLDRVEDRHVLLDLQVTENEKRRDFTEEEVARIYSRMMATSRYHSGMGRPPAGQENIRHALTRVLGKSYATVRRLVERIENGDLGEKQKDSPVESCSNEQLFREVPHNQVERQIAKIRRAVKKVAAKIRKFEDQGLFNADTAAGFRHDLRRVAEGVRDERAAG